MLLSVALIFLMGISLGAIFKKLRLPRLCGMLLTGILLGPYVFSLIDSKILSISSELREMALVIILVKAGLCLDLKDLKKVGRPALLLSFLPAVFEIAGVLLLAPLLLHTTLAEAAIMGAVLGAVSPAVVVPKMVSLIEQGYGTEKSIPQLILAGASLDDVFVIVLFSSFLSLGKGEAISFVGFARIPVSILTGIAVGAGVGFLLFVFFRKVHLRDSMKVILILAVSFLLTAAEKCIEGFLPFSGLLAVMSLAILLKHKQGAVAARLSQKFSKLWLAAEVLLFVLVGAAVNITFAAKAGLAAIAVILGALVFRSVGVWVCLLKTRLVPKERLFCVVSYLPKATVQAAIGGVPLAMGLACGNVVLAVAVVSILITAPLGAFLIDFAGKRCLKKE